MNNKELFNIAGFNRWVGSTDGVHVLMLQCPSWSTIGHTSYKLKATARSYNVTVTHERQILHSTCGHPSTWNDKSLITADEFYKDVKRGKTLRNNWFTLLEYNSEGNVTEAHYRGGWFMVDSGYMAWLCTIPPLKNCTSYKYIRFSEFLERMQKI